MKRLFIIFLIAAFAVISGYSQGTEPKNPGNVKNNPSPSTTESGDPLPVLTPEKFAQITIGLTKDEVRQILANDGEEVSTEKGGGQIYNVVQWTDADNNYIIVTFKNGRVMAFSKSAFKRGVLPRLTPKKFAQIRKGMTKNSVRQILEGLGDEVTTTRGGGQTFNVVKWSDSKYNYIIITFKNGRALNILKSSFK